MDEAKVSTVKTDLINFVSFQCFQENIKWIMCFQRDLPTKTLLFFRISLLKRLIYRRVKSKILLGATIPVTITEI